MVSNFSSISLLLHIKIHYSTDYSHMYDVSWCLESIICKIHFVVTCPAVHLSNGKVTASQEQLYNGKSWYNTTLTFSCNSGYKLDTSPRGSASITKCLATARWSKTVPRCKKSNTQLLEYKI